MNSFLSMADGPHYQASSLAGENLRLWLLLLPAYFLSLLVDGLAAFWPGLAALAAASALAVFIFAPRQRSALASLDWFLAAFFAALFAPENMSWPASLAVGAGCGLWAARPGPLRSLPPLPAWAALGPLAVYGLALGLHNWAGALNPPWRLVSGSEAVALISAGLIWAGGFDSGWRRLIPWLTGGVALALEWSVAVLPSAGAFWYAIMVCRAFWLAGPALFLAPRLGLEGRRLYLAQAPALPLFFLPLVAPGSLDFDAIFYALWLAGLLLAFYRRPKPGPLKLEAAAATEAKARLACAHGGLALAGLWEGLPSCHLAALHDEGPLGCPYGCLALGDCARACPQGAISLNTHGFPVFSEKLCLGCGACVRACPKALPRLVEGSVRVFIPCASQAGLKQSASFCPRACLGCGRCRRACPVGAIGRRGDRGALKVDQRLCQAQGDSCGRACAAACPRNLLGKAGEPEEKA